MMYVSNPARVTGTFHRPARAPEFLVSCPGVAPLANNHVPFQGRDKMCINHSPEEGGYPIKHTEARYPTITTAGTEL